MRQLEDCGVKNLYPQEMIKVNGGGDLLDYIIDNAVDALIDYIVKKIPTGEPTV